MADSQNATEAPAPLHTTPASWLPQTNPVFLREMRESMRTEAKADPWRLKMLILLLSFGGILYASATAGLYHLNAPVVAFYMLAFVESVWVMRPVDPTFLVAKEKQQNTFEPLMLTPLTPGRYLRGHLQHHLALALRRMGGMLPLFGAVYVLGGFTLSQFVVYQLLLLVYLTASNTSVMAIANAQPALIESAATALATRRGARRTAPGANLNPMVILAYVLFPLFMFISNAASRGPLLSILASAGDPASPPLHDLIRVIGLLHPFLALLVYGNTLVFGYPVPVWVMCIVFWILVGQVSYFTFVHQITVRKFRPWWGYRAGRWILFTGVLGLACALAWRLPAGAALFCLALTTLYFLIRFANPMTLPLREPEQWQLLPRTDLLVHRAGNFFPFLLLIALPSWAIQWVLVEKANLPGLGLALFYANAAAYFTIAILLLGGLCARMTRLEKQLRLRNAPPQAPPSPPQDADASKDKKKGAAVMNPAVAVAAVVWAIPLLLLGFEPVARDTPAGPAVSSLVRISEPLLLINPLRLFYLLGIENLERVVMGTALNVVGPPPLPRLGVALPLDYYQAALAAGAILWLALCAVYVRRGRALKRSASALPLPPLQKPVGNQPEPL